MASAAKGRRGTLPRAGAAARAAAWLVTCSSRSGRRSGRVLWVYTKTGTFHTEKIMSSLTPAGRTADGEALSGNRTGS
jgi:hypothetical protein